jgi:hypothetical protein
VSSHTADDVLGEEDPDLLVVLELGVVPQILDCGDTSLVVPGRVEIEAASLAGALVPLRPEQGPGLAEREVDVEENCPQGRDCVRLARARQTPAGQR